MTDLSAQIISEEEGPSSPTVYFVGTPPIAHIGRGVCVDKSIAGAGLPAGILAQLDADMLARAEAEAAQIPGFYDCNDVRQAVLVSMVYQLGNLDTWLQFRAALVVKDYTAAATAMLYSRWASQTPARAARQSSMMRSGDWVPSA